MAQSLQVQSDVLNSSVNKSLSQSESNTLKSVVGNNHMIDKILGETTQTEGEGAGSRKRRETEQMSPSKLKRRAYIQQKRTNLFN